MPPHKGTTRQDLRGAKRGIERQQGWWIHKTYQQGQPKDKPGAHQTPKPPETQAQGDKNKAGKPQTRTPHKVRRQKQHKKL